MASQKISDLLKRQIARNNLLEALGGEVGNFKHDFKDQVKTNVQAAKTDALTQVIGPTETIARNTKKSGELQPGQELDLKAHATEAPKPETKGHAAAAMNYSGEIRRSGENALQRQSRGRESQLLQIRDAIQQNLASAGETTRTKYADIAVGSAPTEVGAYHISFFEQVLSSVQDSRNSDNSSSWLSVAKKRGGMIQNAWKKGNTSVTMSNERQVATQTG